MQDPPAHLFEPPRHEKYQEFTMRFLLGIGTYGQKSCGGSTRRSERETQYQDGLDCLGF